MLKLVLDADGGFSSKVGHVIVRFGKPQILIAWVVEQFGPQQR